jgi:Fe(II)/alpha-ketoglutarate-dependent arginine beta-hydroxylase
MDRLKLDDSELKEIDRLLDDVETSYRASTFEDFLDQVPVFSHDLPRNVRATLNSFRLGRLSGWLSISGYEVNQEALGATPGHWREEVQPSPALREELLLLLYGSLIGDPFCWETQQDGKLIHNVLPIKGDEYEQIGSSSRSLLTWHTEDAFHPMRSDYLLFACMRNPYAAITTIASVDDLDFPESVREVLFEERFFIRPDDSHRPKNNSTVGNADFSVIEEMGERPDAVSVLFGDPRRPFLRVDPYFMSVDDGDDEARYALELVVKLVDEQMQDVRLESGDFFFIDNYRVVHGRKPFVPRHDGSDRWLKRVNVTRDLRKSRQSSALLPPRTVR